MKKPEDMTPDELRAELVRERERANKLNGMVIELQGTAEKDRQEIATLKAQRARLIEQELHLRRTLDVYQEDELARLRPLKPKPDGPATQ